MKGSVKIMLSYDYSHFEVCLGSDEDMSIKQVNELRKQAQRLADEAVRQYHMAKEMAMLRLDILSERKTFLEEIRIIRQKPKAVARTPLFLLIFKSFSTIASLIP